MKLARRILIAALWVSVSGSVGCKTDALWAERQKVDGPVTDRDSPEGIELPDIRIADAREVDLVEEVLTHRAMYHRNLRLLHDYYRDHGCEQKRIWAKTELTGIERVQPFRYLLAAEVPADHLRPVDSIAAADAMYERALELMKEGGHGMPVVYREDLMLKALSVLVEMIRKYPSSDKIDDAAFYCGEIHKEYLKDQEPIAVKWYERAYTWDPETPHSARFQAAVTCDFRLHDRARALEFYRQVLEVETRDKSNVAFATARIRQLTRAESEASPEPSPQPRDMFGSPTEQ